MAAPRNLRRERPLCSGRCSAGSASWNAPPAPSPSSSFSGAVEHVQRAPHVHPMGGGPSMAHSLPRDGSACLMTFRNRQCFSPIFSLWLQRDSPSAQRHLQLLAATSFCLGWISPIHNRRGRCPPPPCIPFSDPDTSQAVFPT